MSTLKVEVVKVDGIESHPNADRLDLAMIKGWRCVVSKGSFKVGDAGVYFPIDSVLPEYVEARIFGPDSKVKLNKHRVRTIKLRGAISQGLLVKPETVGFGGDPLPEGTDVTELLGVTKYEPPVPGFQSSGPSKRTNRNPNKNFHKYTSIENFKNYNQAFDAYEEVVITEKIHGTNFRAGWVPYDTTTFLRKVLHFFHLTPKWEFVYGSHNVQLHTKPEYKGFYEKNVYAEAVHKYDLKNTIQKGEVVYGEIYGPNIQKGYHYGLKDGERKLVIFDIMQGSQYLDHDDLFIVAKMRKLPLVPVLYRGPFGEANLEQLVDGDSVLAPTQKVREGVVIRPIKEVSSYMGRKILKAINPEYLLKDQTDYH